MFKIKIWVFFEFSKNISNKNTYHFYIRSPPPRPGMSFHIKQLVVWEFFQKGLISLETVEVDSFVLSEWQKQQSFCKYVSYSNRRSRVAHCSKPLHNVQNNPNKEQGKGGSSPVAVNQFLNLFLYLVHIFSISFFIWKLSFLHAAYSI